MQLVRLEIATGLADYVIETISSRTIASHVHSEMDLIKIGVPSEHASPILKLIMSHVKVVSFFSALFTKINNKLFFSSEYFLKINSVC